VCGTCELLRRVFDSRVMTPGHLGSSPAAAGAASCQHQFTSVSAAAFLPQSARPTCGEAV
jgi:hypothetical protein